MESSVIENSSSQLTNAIISTAINEIMYLIDLLRQVHLILQRSESRIKLSEICQTELPYVSFIWDSLAS